ncbi:glycosyltransferase [Candidatus Dojkabacteria bacterium]|uniref:Glycosyltransferase n=1 Tax=Candidatus Dojkabacteria bacterium TaxID=2099670 RepID=A0A955I7T0_9BACT|nr:glycosyltransferase [Candidatus Dojkabacteria bacterium]
MSDKSPTISVVIPAYNEELVLGATLETVFAQDYPGEFEVVVSNNNSSDRTAEIAEQAGARVVTETRKGTRFAYDRGMRESTGELILVTNADVRLPKNWISKIVEAYADPEVVGVGTRVKFYGAPEWTNTFLDIANNKLNPKKAMWGVSLSCRRWVYDQVGGFDHGVNTNEDAVFTLLIEKFGKVKILDDVVVEMDGRRFNNGFFSAVKEWSKSYGLNSLFLQASFLTTGNISTLVRDFGDYRSHVFGKGEDLQIAVIVPTANDQMHIAQLLTSLEAQDFQHRFKVYVLDNFSVDKSLGIAKVFTDVTVASYPGIYNSGARLAKLLASIPAPVIAFTNPHALLPADWLSHIYAEFNKQRKQPLNVLTGPYIKRTSEIVSKITDQPLEKVLGKLEFSNFAIDQKSAAKLLSGQGDLSTVAAQLVSALSTGDYKVAYEYNFKAFNMDKDGESSITNGSTKGIKARLKKLTDLLSSDLGE